MKPPAKPPVAAVRDPNAVVVRLHNRTKAELVVKCFVRDRYIGLPLSNVLRLPTVVQESYFKARSDVEVPLFAVVPLQQETIGAYSIEINTDETEMRLGVIDVSVKEMDEARLSKKFILVFRDNGIDAFIGKKARFVHWIRPVPTKKVARPEYSPESMGSEGEDQVRP
ncbi:MAG: hypothetical protein JST30_08240 [Armatimonadetes bacterium]|nr:hypothetical protein [Armatimonadota bacterium]